MMPNNEIITNLFEVLSNSGVDNIAGIKVNHLTGNDDMSIFGAEIAIGTCVRAHYHNSGIEIYHIVSGEGNMNIGQVMDNGAVSWLEQFSVGKGDSFTIKPKQVHKLKNSGNEKLIALFGCSTTHLSSDRVVVEDV